MRSTFPLSRFARLTVETLEDRCNPSTAYLATDLISDQPGVARITDPTLVNAWGLSLNPAGGAFWVSANGTGLSEVYGGDVNGSAISQPFKVTIPGGLPTGQVFNASTTDFQITAGGVTRSSAFIFASLTGAITGWNPAVPPTTPAPSRTAVVGFQATDGAVYTGLALAKIGTANFLYAADFRNGKIDVINSQFQLTQLDGDFTDPNLPAGYAPFNVAVIGGKLYVTYAKQGVGEADTGRGQGFVSVFDTNGHLLQRFASRGVLNAPWAVVQAPAGFGDFGGAILVGNFGNGRINAFDATTGERFGALSESQGHPLVIDGLWGLAFGNGVTAGDANSLYYAAGPDGETHGLFGKITANAEGTNPVSAQLVGTDLVITGSRHSDQVRVRLNNDGHLVVRAGGEVIGAFDTAAVQTIRFNGFAGNDVFLIDSDVAGTVVADGGAGNDRLDAGGGSAVLLGNAGHDFLFGGRNRDILIGGDGRDFVLGGSNDDILIGGRTAHDANSASLLQLLAAWNSTASYEDRVATIRAGTGVVPKLDATTVFDDAARDLLLGGSGLDWFLGVAPDIFLDRKAGEATN